MALYRLTGQHAISFSVNNLFDIYYYEKLGFPQYGRMLALNYQFGVRTRP
jgi:hypothetical protein